MPFEFLKYLQPTHYFQLYTNTGQSVFPVVENLPKNVIKELGYDNNFEPQIVLNDCCALARTSQTITFGPFDSFSNIW